jgi:hypothetical protein
MKRTALLVSGLLGVSLLSLSAFEYTPVTVTGYDYDGVVENNATPGSNPNVYTGVSQTLDETNNVFYENGLSGATGGTGLPTSNQVTASSGGDTFTFNLADYGSGTGLTNNFLEINPAEGNQRLTLTTPASFVSLSFLGFSAEAQSLPATGNVIVNFSSGLPTTYTGALAYPDWYTGSGSAINPVIFNSAGRIRNTDGAYNQSLSFPLNSGSGGKLYASTIFLSAEDQLRQVTSVDFDITSADAADRTYVVGVAGAVPEPGTVALVGVGLAAVLLRARRRRA